MNHTFVFLGGMPRSGSTLISNLLAQNPAMHATATSGILGMMTEVRNFWHSMPEFRAMAEEETEKRKVQCLRGMLEGYFADIEKPVIVEKSRGWVGQLEMAAKIIQGEPKVIAPVRDIRDILCSFEKLYRASKDTRQLDFEKHFPVDSRTMEGRMNIWSAGGGMVGSCFDSINDAVTRGWRKSIHFVEYNELTTKPAKAMQGIYKFLGMPEFSHDFDDVKQVTVEDDLVYGWKDLHVIRPKVTPQESAWPKIMTTDLAKKYEKDATFWRYL